MTCQHPVRLLMTALFLNTSYLTTSKNPIVLAANRNGDAVLLLSIVPNIKHQKEPIVISSNRIMTTLIW